MNHAKIFKGWPHRDASWALVLHPTDFYRAEMMKPTMLSNKSSTARSCAENQILENEILEIGLPIFVLNDE